MEQFSCRTQIFFGDGAATAPLPWQTGRLMVVTDPFFYENGTARRIAEAAMPEAVCYFHRIEPDPTVTLAAEGAAEVKAFRPDTIMALGGGSAMDCAKAMAYFSGTKARLIAIPTTSGSGSEVTDFAILTHDGVKHPLIDPALQPDGAIVDGQLVAALPPKLVADGGFDALTHALEAFTATNSGAVTDALALSAFQTVFANLERSFAGQQVARKAIHAAATTAALAFTHAGLGLCHALSHSLGGAFHLPHGRLNGILLPAVITCNTPAAGQKYAALARACGLEGRSETLGSRNLRSGLIRLRKALCLPATLAEAGISPNAVRQQIGRIVEATLADPCCATNPLPINENHVRQVLSQVTGHG